MPVMISYNGSAIKLQQAIKKANEILASTDFLNIIRSRTTPFDESVPSNLSPTQIADTFASSTLILSLLEYKTRSSVGGKFNTGYPKIIWANLNALPLRTVCSLAAMLVHETTHALSYNVPGIAFSHDNQDPGFNQETAPYWIQNRVKKQFCPTLTKIEMNEYILVDLEEQEEDLK